jgi:hypothetical protein
MTPEEYKRTYAQIELVLRQVSNDAYETSAEIVDCLAARGKSPMEISAAIRSLKDKEDIQ